MYAASKMLQEPMSDINNAIYISHLCCRRNKTSLQDCDNNLTFEGVANS